MLKIIPSTFAIMILYFSSGLIAIVLIVFYLNKQERNVGRILKKNKNVVPLYKLRAAQQKAELIRNQLASQQSTTKQQALQNTLDDLDHMYQNNKLSVTDYNIRLDRLSRQI